MRNNYDYLIRIACRARSSRFLYSERPGRFVSLCLLVVCVLSSFCLALADDKQDKVVTFSSFRPRKEIIGEKFLGSTACASCHSEKSSSHSHSSMAHALQSAAASNVLRTHPKMTFRAGRFSYEIVSDGAQSVYRVTDGKDTLSEPILYAFGNAHLGQTYVFRRDGKLYEGRVSYYTAIDRLDWTIGDVLNPPPSLEEAAGRDISGDEARNCFSCHGTGAVVDSKLKLERLIPGVTCEACHGPGEKHATAKLLDTGADAPEFNPKTLDAETLSQEFCGACHRGVDSVAMMPDLGGISNVRFQPYRLFNSRGHDPKDPRLTCTACHDPHLNLNQQDAANDSHCKACHDPRAPAQTPHAKQDKSASATHRGDSSPSTKCPVADAKCVTCHMPKVDVPGSHFQFTDHRIRVAQPGEPYPY